ncbi:TetR/AcrR family transcriptional regulator [Nocardia otitidiscaviarum]|uniref:TetR/AcrR family transcriptional regulator n=1 Tax=Nocardia otitidiscaviarum TaxID=1823 RepID=UPI00189617AC|nr:TetR/AcrR family transcriptional regulator [Nocardia otitidiscaviarum]MBF6132449.1 TetR/AcrR family transcriptional regulator [Nocardia otitidiscaviarum]
MTKAVRQRRRPTQERAKATREHILDTAARLFGERGIADTSTNRIAAEAGVSIGTLYRYFSDRSVIVDELLGRLLESSERRFTQWVSEISREQVNSTFVDALPELITELLEVFTEELVANAKLVRALVAGVQFYSSGLPEFEPRLRLLVKVLLIQLLGPGDDHRYDVMTFVLINTGFAGVLRTSALDVDGEARREAIASTARMISAWMESEQRDARTVSATTTPVVGGIAAAN